MSMIAKSDAAQHLKRKDLFDLTGKTVVITGGAGYLGSAMSEALAAYGADLFVLGRNQRKAECLAEELKRVYDLLHCRAVAFDLANAESIREALQGIAQETGRIDVLINNAAYTSPATEFTDYSDASWEVAIDGTINSVARMIRLVLPYMLSQGKGNIINVASMYGMVAPNMEIYGNSGQNNPANYGAGKAAVIQLTRYIASVYGKAGIRANAISPGPFPNHEVQKNENFIEELSRKNPLGRIGLPADLQGIVIYLASEASRYTTGQNIAVDGGWTAW